MADAPNALLKGAEVLAHLVRMRLGRGNADISAEVSELLGDCSLSAGGLPLLLMGRLHRGGQGGHDRAPQPARVRPEQAEQPAREAEQAPGPDASRAEADPMPRARGRGARGRGCRGACGARACAPRQSCRGARGACCRPASDGADAEPAAEPSRPARPARSPRRLPARTKTARGLADGRGPLRGAHRWARRGEVGVAARTRRVWSGHALDGCRRPRAAHWATSCTTSSRAASDPMCVVTGCWPVGRSPTRLRGRCGACLA